MAAVVDAEYIDHQGLGGMALKSADGFSRVVTAARTAVSDLRVSIEDLIAEDDRVAARLPWHGTGKVFKYSRGDQTARDEAIAYGLSVGIPRHQLDWKEYLD